MFFKDFSSNISFNSFVFNKMIHTDNEENIEAVVEWWTDDQPRDTEGQEAIAEGRRDGGEEAYRVAGHQRWDSAIMIGYIAEY